jgi:hypothetical protein
MSGGPRSRRLVAAGLAASAAAVAMALAGPAPAFAAGGGNCQQSTGSLTLSPSTITAGQSVTASWTTHRPAGCEGVVSQLNGPGASVSGGVGGTATLTPPVGVDTYTVTVFFPAGSVDVASASVTVQSPGNATVPNVQLDEESDAIARIQGAGLVVGTDRHVDDCNSPGDVEMQDPIGGAIVLRGTAVNITVSTCSGIPK